MAAGYPDPNANSWLYFELTGALQNVSDIVPDLVGSVSFVLTASDGSFFGTSSYNSQNTSRITNSSETFGHEIVTDAFLTASRGNCTLEAILFISSSNPSYLMWSGPRGAGESDSTNYTGDLTMQSDGFMNLFWEYDEGTNVSMVTSGTTITRDKWIYFAMTRNYSPVSGTTTVKWYVDGVETNSITQAVQLPSTGAGADQPFLRVKNHGFIDSMRFSSGARSPTEISVTASLSASLEADGKTVALWQFFGQSQGPSLKNQGSWPTHLSRIAGGTNYNWQPLVVGSGSASYVGDANIGTTNFYTDHPGNIINDDWTADMWVFRPFNDSTRVELFSYSESGESKTTNYLFRWYVDTDSTFRTFQERGNGTNLATFVSTGSIPSSQLYLPFHFAVVKTTSSTPEFVYDLYLNGQFFETTSGSHTFGGMPEGGEEARFGLGGAPADADTSFVCQFFHMQKGALSASQILDLYNLGVSGTIVYVSESAPSLILEQVFRGYVGSEAVYWIDTETAPDGVTNVVLIDERVR